MPSKAAQVIAYLSVLIVSVLVHRFVYGELKRVLLRDYPKSGANLARIGRNLFMVMDAPFLYLYFRGAMSPALMAATTWLLYPFLVWQAILLMWAVILTPFALWRRTGAFGTVRLRERIRSASEKRDLESDNVDYDSPLEVAAE